MSKNSNSLSMWKQACDLSSVQFCSKGSNDYAVVKKTFDALKLASQTPEMIIWNSCCEKLGYKFVKKDTPEYVKVKALFITKMS